jgi:MtrB/PioB family decaheme-associated outer membrane protein
MKKVLCLTTALFLGSAASPAASQEQLESEGGFTIGVQQIDIDPNSAKFNEYRDIRDGFQLYDLWFDLIDGPSARFLDFRGSNLLREDQAIDFRFGEFGRWNFEINRREIPRRISNQAVTPYIYRGDGLFVVPAQVPIVEEGVPSLVPPGPAQNNPSMQLNDALIAAWLPDNLRPVELGTQRNRTSALLNLPLLEQINFRLRYSDERRDGFGVTYGPFGDRPPRTHNIQLPEPIDYTTREMGFDAEYGGSAFQANLSYLYSDFDNNVETMRWENIYFTPEPGADFVATVVDTPRNVSTVGQRSLAPDNFAHHVSLAGGVNMPMNGRLAATVAYGWMKQNQTLLPYSFSSLGLDWQDPNKLPRQRADAEMRTTRADLDYTFNPLKRLNLRAFLRYYDLDNRTPTDQWLYVTQDTATTAGGVDYRNHRQNLAYEYDKLNYGLDASQYFAFWRSTLTLGYEREEIDRDFREADTDENIFKASLRTRPANWLALRAGYRYGDRSAGTYNDQITALSYWYTQEQAPTGVGVARDNPSFAFANHPDLRKYDVSDRERNEFDLAASIAALQDLELGAAFGYRKDDFDSGVRPTQPLLDFPNPERLVPGVAETFTLGQQLGLLEQKQQNYSVDAHYAPSSRWSFNLFGNHQRHESDFRGMVFNENRRENLDEVGPAIGNLGRWDDGRYLFDASLDDRTNTFGAGAGFEVIPGRLRLSTNYTLSRGKVDLEYSGYGTPEVLGDPVVGTEIPWGEFQFAFDDPETVRHNQYVFNASLEYQVVQGLIFGFHYLFDRYSLQDWMLEAEGPWVEQVGSEFFLRDTSRDNRWGNRLVTMGTVFGPSYEAHVGSVTMTYRF